MQVRLVLSLIGLSGGALILHAVLAAQGVPGPGAVTLLVTVPLALVLTVALGRPLRRAADFAERLSRGEQPLRLPETAAGQAGDLYRALNRLAEQYRLGLEQRGAEKSETEVLLREMGEGVLALDRDGRIVRTNAELRSVVGASEPLEGRVASAVFRNPQLVSFLDPDSVPQNGCEGEFDFFGRTMLVAARRMPAGGVVAVFSDLTELRRLDAVRTEFVANASHELKTPLTAIRGFAETLSDPETSASDQSRFAARIVSHADRMTAIVDDLLSLARLEDPRRDVHHEPIRFGALMEEILDGMSTRIAAADMFVVVQTEPNDLEVGADPEGLRQILENLIDNAIKHSGAANLVVRAERLPSGEVDLSVRDDGQGIPTVHLARIFERFYRVDPSRSRASGGTGLGLSIVKHWAEAMGGRVTATSTIGEGTRIRVRLPAPVSAQA